MTQVLDKTNFKEAVVFDRVITIKPTPRFERFRETCMAADPVVRIDHARIYSRVMKETDGDPMVIRRAKAFCAVVREMPINIDPDDLFVGYVDGIWAGQQVSDGKGELLERALDSKGKRAFVLSEEDERELREEIIPYWKGPKGDWSGIRNSRNYDLIDEDKYQIYPPFILRRSLSRSGGGTVLHGHECLDLEKIVKKGILGVKKDAEERLARLDYADPDEVKRVPFLKGVIMAMAAAAEIGERFAARARELAEEAEDATRKAELLEIAEVCDWVPANPARTFCEALQSFWFAYFLVSWENMETAAQAVGRMDQYLYPYYERDIGEGRLTREEAQELIDFWLLKLQHIRKCRDGDFYRVGGDKGAHLSVGGYKADGSDATNELSYMFIEAIMHLSMPQPFFSVQVHSRMRDDFLLKACQLTSLGLGQPQFENADVIVPGLITRETGGPPITMEDARGFTSIGCQEPMIVGKDGLKQAGIMSVVSALEFALNDGVSRQSHERSGLETGDPRQFKSFEEVREAYEKQLAWQIKKFTLINNMDEVNLAEMRPTVFRSALIEDCIEKGMSREEGGARYNAGPGLISAGLPDVADSLAAIEKLVFEDKRITMAELCDALDHNFEGYEDIRKMCLDVPKYGNDDDYVDEHMVWAAREWAAECRKQRNTRGGHGVPGIQAFVFYPPFGAALGALPSGRLAGEPISDGAAPCLGKDVNGPTAVLKSVSKHNSFEQNMCDILNMSLDPEMFEDEDGFDRLAGFIRTMVDQQIQHIVFNVVSADTLRVAQKEPDKYRNLVVRIAGSSAFFVDLTEGLQNGIIARKEHRV